MKILKGLFFTLLALVLIFLAFGLFMPTVHYGAEITVNKPVQEAWAVAGDDAKTAQWIEGMKSEELISGEKNKAGSKYKVIVDPGEGEEDFEMTETIVEIVKNDHLTLEFDSEMMEFGQTMTFSEVDGKTNIKTASNVKGKGIFMRSMFAVMETLGGSFQKQEEKHLNSLKNLIETNQTDYFGSDSTAIVQ